MPLAKGKKNVGHNLGKLEEGYPNTQAIAIAPELIRCGYFSAAGLDSHVRAILPARE